MAIKWVKQRSQRAAASTWQAATCSRAAILPPSSNSHSKIPTPLQSYLSHVMAVFTTITGLEFPIYILLTTAIQFNEEKYRESGEQDINVNYYISLPGGCMTTEVD